MEHIETSLLGDIRDHRVPCSGCMALTHNWSARCNACKRRDAERAAFEFGFNNADYLAGTTGDALVD